MPAFRWCRKELICRWLRWFHRPATAMMVATESLEARDGGAWLHASAHLVARRGCRDNSIPSPDARLPYEGPIWLYVGRVAVEKNIEAFLALDLPGTKVVVGDGPATRRAARQISRSAKFLGALTGEALTRAYAGSDVFVFPSRTDTFGLVTAGGPGLRPARGGLSGGGAPGCGGPGVPGAASGGAGRGPADGLPGGPGAGPAPPRRSPPGPSPRAIPGGPAPCSSCAISWSSRTRTRPQPACRAKPFRRKGLSQSPAARLERPGKPIRFPPLMTARLRSRARLTAREYAFLGLTHPVLGRLSSSCWARTPAGTSAIITGTRPTPCSTTAWRMDVAVAHQASYYNPFLDIPFYWLATHTHAWIALGVLGAVQGANVVPLYLIAREGLRIRRPQDRWRARWRCWARSGALTLTEFGTTYYDNVMSVFVLSGLAILVVEPRDAARRPARQGGRRLPALAGLITGMAMGLKLPEMPFCVGFAAALVALGGKLEAPGGAADRRAALAGVVGFALFSARGCCTCSS